MVDLTDVSALDSNGGNESNRSTTASSSCTNPQSRTKELPSPHLPESSTPRLETSPDPTAAVWAVDSVLGYELFNMFFDKVPIGLLNRPQFLARYSVFANGQGRFIGREHLQKDEVFMISGIFALAARFCDSVEFADIPGLTRGSTFEDDASTLLHDIVAEGTEDPTLNFICGCVILALFYFSDGRLGCGSALIGVCLRYAYDVNLHAIDVQDLDQSGGAITTGPFDTESWVAAEQRRRIWWNIWKIEVFSSSMACKPCSIDLKDVAVRLPVADADWFAKNPVESAVLIDHPRTAWKTLSNVGSESPLAWFLLGLYLVSQANTALRRPMRPSPDFITELSSSICCFKLALPTSLSLKSICFDRNDHKDANWAVQMHIMILTAEAMIEDLQARERPSTSERRTSTNFLNRQESTFLEIVQAWPPSFIPLSEPLICGTLGRVAALPRRSDSCFQIKEMSRLMLAKIAEYWKLGQMVLTVVEATDCAVDLHTSKKEHFFNRLKFLWHTKASQKVSESRGAGGSENHLLSNHEYHDPSLESDNSARSYRPLGPSDDPPTWDYGSPWRYSAIFDDFLNGNNGEGWQESNSLVATERAQDATSNCRIFSNL